MRTAKIWIFKSFTKLSRAVVAVNEPQTKGETFYPSLRHVEVEPTKASRPITEEKIRGEAFQIRKDKSTKCNLHSFRSNWSLPWLIIKIWVSSKTLTNFLCLFFFEQKSETVPSPRKLILMKLNPCPAVIRRRGFEGGWVGGWGWCRLEG